MGGKIRHYLLELRTPSSLDSLSRDVWVVGHLTLLLASMMEHFAKSPTLISCVNVSLNYII